MKNTEDQVDEWRNWREKFEQASRRERVKVERFFLYISSIHTHTME